jgi:hypothetical protein
MGAAAIRNPRERGYENPRSSPQPVSNQTIHSFMEGQTMTANFLNETEKLFGEMTQTANRIADARKHTTDHQVAAQLHRIETAMRDCGRLIASALASVPPNVRDRLDAIEVS